MSAKPASPTARGAVFGLASALLFGASIPLAKLLLTEVPSFLLSGLFYLGSGLGLAATFLWQKSVGDYDSEAAIRKADMPTLVSAIFFGGICAGLLLMWGLSSTPASEASLLLNLEGVFSALIAWIIFREHADKRIVAGMLMLTAGAFALSWGNGGVIRFGLGGWAIIAACLCWGIDNNLTRRVAHLNPLFIAACKGLVAGAVNVGIALVGGAHLPQQSILLSSLVIGFFGYGLSLVFFIISLRHAGASRTSAYFSLAPFIGAFGGLIFLHEPIMPGLAAAAILMGLGLYLHLTEHHEHEHTHPTLTHEHAHVHDEHHRHTHGPEDPEGEPHSHQHTHEEVTHSHAHLPDIHHRHIH